MPKFSSIREEFYPHWLEGFYPCWLEGFYPCWLELLCSPEFLAKAVYVLINAWSGRGDRMRVCGLLTYLCLLT